MQGSFYYLQEPLVANDILSHQGFVLKKLCNNYNNRTIQRFYQVGICFQFWWWVFQRYHLTSEIHYIHGWISFNPNTKIWSTEKEGKDRYFYSPPPRHVHFVLYIHLPFAISDIPGKLQAIIQTKFIINVLPVSVWRRLWPHLGHSDVIEVGITNCGKHFQCQSTPASLYSI